MKNINTFFYAILILISPITHALTTDKDQAIEIEADAAELDDKKNVTIYTGNVIVTQGSIRMTGEKMTVYYTDDNDLDTVIIEGHPATYRQLPDNSEVYDEAQAKRMEYNNSKSLVVLIDNAIVKQEDLRFSGSRIEYDTENSKIRAKGQASTADKTATDTEDTGGRVRITIKPGIKDKK